jgi:hypothetical protein
MPKTNNYGPKELTLLRKVLTKVILEFFHIFDHNHPSLTSLGPKDLENDKKKFQLNPSLAEIFDINRKTRFFVLFQNGPVPVLVNGC